MKTTCVAGERTTSGAGGHSLVMMNWGFISKLA